MDGRQVVLIGIFGAAAFVIMLVAVLTERDKKSRYVLFILSFVVLGIGFAISCDPDIAMSAEQKQAQYKADFDKKSLDLRCYFMVPGIAKDRAWWLNLPRELSARQIAWYFVPYKKVLAKCPLPRFKEGSDWDQYFIDNVYPALFRDYALTYCPPSPTTSKTPEVTGVTINGQVPESPAPNVYIVPEAKPQ